MSEWPNVKLADVADIRFSNVDKKSTPGELAVRLCNYMDVYGNGGYVTADRAYMDASASHAEVERFGIEKGDVIITKDSETPDDIGIPAVVLDDIPKLVCGYHLALIRPNRKAIHPIYLAMQLATKTTATYYSRLANGSTRYGLSSSAIASTRIPLAPLLQQRRIAEILSTVDEAIEQTEALIEKLRQVKAGLMHDLFTRGVTPDGHLRPRATRPRTSTRNPRLGGYRRSGKGFCLG
ncbi:MAG: restriction endonuclease subunit S [Planctomycetota bacterium]|nr:restriction endonuclease subunit S [Planctomycetota bacterium]